MVKGTVSTRKHERIPCRIHVAYDSARGFLEDYAVNLSEGGLCLFVDNELNVGEKIDIHLKIPEAADLPVINAEVVWRKRAAGSDEGTYETGLEFRFDDPELRKRFRGIVDNIEREYKEDLLEKPTVLIVDDDRMAISMMKDALEEQGCHVFSTCSPFETCFMIRSCNPDLVLLDVNMPGLKGDSICKTLRTYSIFKELKVFLYSSMPEEEVSSMAGESGADGYFIKNGGFEDLIPKVNEVLDFTSSR